MIPLSKEVVDRWRAMWRANANELRPWWENPTEPATGFGLFSTSSRIDTDRWQRADGKLIVAQRQPPENRMVAWPFDPIVGWLWIDGPVDQITSYKAPSTRLTGWESAEAAMTYLDTLCPLPRPPIMSGQIYTWVGEDGRWHETTVGPCYRDDYGVWHEANSTFIPNRAVLVYGPSCYGANVPWSPLEDSK